MSFPFQIKNSNILKIINLLKEFLQGKENPIILSLLSIFSKGHILIEDYPGVGKTVLALAISKIFGLNFGRIQCTPDLLPSDILGINIYDKNLKRFIFKKGPIFNNIVLVDEINRTSPKTQSALLEVMEEKQVTVDDKTYKLEEPFFVIATQNPSEFSGTFKLPNSQMDRFLISFSIGFPDKTNEIEMLKKGSIHEKIDKIEKLISKDEILTMQSKIEKIYVSDKVLEYIVKIAEKTRENKYLIYGVTPRATLSLKECAKTLAYFSNRDYVNYYDVKLLAPYVLSHRLVLKEDYSSVNKIEIIKDILEQIPAV